MKKSETKSKTKKSLSYQIDQSGKIEHTNKAIVVALADGKVTTIKITAVEKQKLMKLMKELRRPHKTYAYDIFSALIFLLLRQHPVIEIEIDKEYPGHEAGIKERLIQFFEKRKIKIPEINFGLVGKKSNTHLSALAVFQNKAKPSLIVKAEDILEVLYSTKKGWRPRSGRGNP